MAIISKCIYLKLLDEITDSSFHLLLQAQLVTEEFPSKNNHNSIAYIVLYHIYCITCIILYCIALYRIVLHYITCIILYSIVLHYLYILYYIVCNVLYCIISYIMYCIALYYLHHIIL